MGIEIRVHRFLYLFVLGPLLGYWLAALMFSLGIAFATIASASAAGYDMTSGPGPLSPWIIGFGLPFVTLVVGWVRERRRLAAGDLAAAGEGMPFPERQGAKLREDYEAIWRSLGGGGTAPRLICLPNFRIAAHAYDGPTGRAIEVSAGLAARLVQGDSLALSILRHEVAHLAHRDLPAIRRQSLMAGAAAFSADCAMLACLIAAMVIVLLTDLGPFPKSPTLANIVFVHLAIMAATLIVVLPLFLGRYVLKRYSAFLVALAEMRADASAGLWGDGLTAFSAEIERDPSVRPTTLLDQGLAYISTALSHFPPRERIALLRQPQRLATPKLRYFAIAIFCIWFLQFHQGSQGWDVLLLALSVALLQALTAVLLLSVAGHLMLSPARAATLAFGTLTFQALPLIKLEGVAYLSMHLAAALITPGGFGIADSNYFEDIWVTLAEFLRFANEAVGGFGGLLALAIAAGSFFYMNRIATPPVDFRRGRIAAVATIVALTSLLVSYRFFQPQLQVFAEAVAYRWSSANDTADSRNWLSASTRDAISGIALRMSDRLDEAPLLEDLAWLRLVLPQLFGGLATLLLFWRPIRWSRA